MIIKLIAMLLGTIFIVSFLKILMALDANERKKHKIYLHIFITSLVLLMMLLFLSKLIIMDFKFN